MQMVSLQFSFTVNFAHKKIFAFNDNGVKSMTILNTNLKIKHTYEDTVYFNRQELG